MVAGIRALRKIYYGKEAASSDTSRVGSKTAVAATAQLIGTLGMTLNQEIHQPNQWETGRMSSFENSTVIGREVTLPFDSDATYDHMDPFFLMAIKGGVTKTTGVATYSPNYTDSNVPDSYTFEYGDDVQAYEVSNVGCRQLELSGSMGQVLALKADLFGKDMTETTFTSSISYPSREVIPAAHAKFYAADSYAGVYASNALVSGAEESGTLIDFGWRFMTGFSPQKFADRDLSYTDIAEAKRHVELDMTMAFNSTVKDWFDDVYRAQDHYWFGLEFDNGKATTNQRYLRLLVGGKITQYSGLAEREGQDIVSLKVMSEYDATSGVAKDMEVIVKSAGS